jgi:hypothetical protein
VSPLLLIELVVIYLLLCLIAGFLGRRRRIGFWGFVFVSILLTPLVSTLFIFLAAPARRVRPVRPAVKRT